MDPREQWTAVQHQPSNQPHQRFSWQMPPNAQSEAPRSSQRAPQQPQDQRTQTSADSRSRVFSYAQTPIEHRSPAYTSDEPLPNSPPTPIDPRPQSIYSNDTAQSQQQPAYPSHPYQAAATPLSAHHPTYPQVVPSVSPAPVQQAHTPHDSQPRQLAPINTNIARYSTPAVPPTPHSHRSQPSPLPLKLPLTPVSPGRVKKEPTDYPLPTSPTSTKMYATEPYSPHGFASTPNRTVFSPDAFAGPNGLDPALHQPGQITHPNMDLSASGSSHEWKHSLCECSDVGTCTTGLFCPCVLYGKTSYRLTQKADKKDPTDLLGYSATNGHCMLMSVSCGLWWLFPMIQRTRLRHLYKLAGSFGSDLAKGCCCCCCVAIQNEKEMRDREESSRRWAGPASTEVYKAPPQMAYAPQQ